MLGDPKNKPEVLQQIEETKKNRIKRLQELQQKKDDQNMSEIKNYYEKLISEKSYLINELLKKVKSLSIELEKEKEKNKNK